MQKLTHQLVEWLGWLGVAAIFGAYALLSFGMLTSDQLIYQLLNLFGGFAILVDAWVDRNYQPVVLNALWALVALVSIVGTFV